MPEHNHRYIASATARKFHRSDAFVRGIMGPVGSGKSVACVNEIMLRASKQKKAKDGFRYTRWLIVRNTYSDLETTTMATWDAWFPEHVFGHRSRKPPYTQSIQVGDIRMEVIFMALDKPEDAKKLLSFEPTGIWFNEAREIPKELIDAATSRLGRYPSTDLGGCTWSGVILDTNPPDDEHWWYDMCENGMWRWDHKEKCLRDESEFSDEKRWEFFRQPSGLSDEAENLENLMQTEESLTWDLEARRKRGRIYYERMMAGKTEEWINVYVHGNYGFIQEGKAVFQHEWNDDIHCVKKSVDVIPGLRVYIGLDCSGRNPAAVFLPATPQGQIRVFHELVTEGMGAVAFARALKMEVHKVCPDNDVEFYGDPAGGWKSQNNEETYFDILRTEGMIVMPATDGLRIAPRIEAVKAVLSRLVNGEPCLQVSQDCKILRKGFNGGYFYKRFNTSGGAHYSPEPDKRGNRCADAMDGFTYALVGIGEVKKIRGKQRKMFQTNAGLDFDVYE